MVIRTILTVAAAVLVMVQQPSEAKASSDFIRQESRYIDGESEQDKQIAYQIRKIRGIEKRHTTERIVAKQYIFDDRDAAFARVEQEDYMARVKALETKSMYHGN